MRPEVPGASEIEADAAMALAGTLQAVIVGVVLRLLVSPLPDAAVTVVWWAVSVYVVA